MMFDKWDAAFIIIGGMLAFAGLLKLLGAL